MTLLIEDGLIVTLDRENRILVDDVILIKDDRIEFIGKKENMPLAYQQIPSIKVKGSVIFPGFVNLHTHATLSILRGIGDDMGVAPAYAPNIPQGVFISPQEAHILSLLGGVEALKFGTTCIVDNYIYENEAAVAFDNLGLRAVVSERLHDADLFKVLEGRYEFDEKRGNMLLGKATALYEQWHGASDGRILTRIGPHAPDTCSTIYLEKLRDLAYKMDVGLVTHVAQSQREIEEIKNRSGKSSVEYLESLGLLSNKMIAGHCIYVSEEDINVLAGTNTHVSHQSGSNSKGGMMAPINAMIDKGINIGLGTDNMARDMVEVMRLAVVIARMLTRNQTALKALDVLKMATRNGAKALGLEQTIGSLEVGKKADLFTVDFRRAHLTPVVDPIANFVHNGLGSDVDLVIVDGQILVEDGLVKTIDEISLLKEAQSVTHKLWSDMQSDFPLPLPLAMKQSIY